MGAQPNTADIEPTPDRKSRGGGGRVSKGEQARRCALHRVERPVSDMIRFVLAPDGQVVADLKRNLPGRGVWLCGQRTTVEEATARNLFSQAFKQSAAVSEDLPVTVERLLFERCIKALSLAKKAGAAVSGFAKVDHAISKGLVHVLIHAADGAADGRDKLSRKFEAVCRDRGHDAQIVAALTSSQISLALGRSNVVHAGLTDRGIAQAFLSEMRRLARFQTPPDGLTQTCRAKTGKE